MTASGTKELARNLAETVDRLQQDIQLPRENKSVFADIREVRRSLTMLEQGLRNGDDSTVGDAS